MDPRHPTLLPSLTDALENVRHQRAAGLSGLSDMEGAGIPEIGDPHEVSHTHPFTPERESGVGEPLKKRRAPTRRTSRHRSRKAR